MTPLLWGAAALTALLVVIPAALAWSFSQRMTARRRPDPPTHPTDYGLPYEEVAFPARDGIPLRGWFIPAAQARGTVVFCHGHAGSMDPDLRYAPWFHQAGFSVLMFDLRGHGRSGGERVSMGTLEREDLLGAMDYLAGRGIARVGVLGFSMGGAVALLTAPLDERVAAVATDGAFVRLEETLVGWAREAAGLPRWLARPLARAVRYATALRLGVRLQDPIHWIGQLAPRPVLLIHGDCDPYISVEAVEALYAAAGEPKELWRVPQAGHRQVDQHCPEAYRSRVVGFFEQHL